MDLAQLGRLTLGIVDAGRYEGPVGPVDFRAAVREAIDGTHTIRPAEAAELATATPRDLGNEAAIEITDESTFQAARRLSATEPVTALNFASARRVGGGFLGGARAQEEALCRASGLFRCLERERDYYRANQEHPDTLYTDHAIWSPSVPFFRDDDHALLEAPFPLSVVTSPAPNTNALRPDLLPHLAPTFHRRARQVLAIAAARPPRALVLGAWGCGAFGGDPRLAADAFATTLDTGFRRAFSRIVFAVLANDARGERNLAAFRTRLG